MKEFVLGIDMGSAYSKGILMRDQEVLAAFSCPSGGDLKLTAEKIRLELLSGAGLKDREPCYTVATGFGAKSVSFADTILVGRVLPGKGRLSPFPLLCERW